MTEEKQTAVKSPLLKQGLEGLRSNLEIFIIAFILAMTIRCFCIDGFQIPSGSMEPTLIGSMNGGDRLIAHKFIYFVKPIERFEVILFKFPLDRTKNFIKRVVGLPNEELRVSGGDIYYRPKGTTKFLLASKPLSVQESIWIPVYQWEADRSQIEDHWYLPSAPVATVVNKQVHLYPTKESEAFLEYRGTIKDQYKGSKGKISGGNFSVPDIKLSFNCRPSKDSIIKVMLNTFNERINITLPTPNGARAQGAVPPGTRPAGPVPTGMKPNEGSLEIASARHPTKRLPLTTVLRADSDYFIEIINYDGQVIIRLNGGVLASYRYCSELEETDDRIHSPQIKLGAAGKSEVSFWNITIGRDVYYYADSAPISIPDRKYFVIGDNVSDSHDSRAWRLKEINLNDGTLIKSDVRYITEDADTLIIHRDEQDPNKGGDIWGNEHRIPRDKIKDINEWGAGVVGKIGKEAYIFVDISDIFGRALFIYWPLNRLKFIK